MLRCVTYIYHSARYIQDNASLPRWNGSHVICVTSYLSANAGPPLSPRSFITANNTIASISQHPWQQLFSLSLPLLFLFIHLLHLHELNKWIETCGVCVCVASGGNNGPRVIRSCVSRPPRSCIKVFHFYYLPCIIQNSYYRVNSHWTAREREKPVGYLLFYTN